jgi:hypothetical protein
MKLDHWEKFVTMPVRRSTPPPTPVVRLPPHAVQPAPKAPDPVQKRGRRRPDQRKRSRKARDAAQEARWERVADLYRNSPHLSLPDIARIVGYRNHTTLFYILKRMGVYDPSARRQAKDEARQKFHDAERARIEARKQARLRLAEEKENRAARKVALRLKALAERHALAAERRALGTGWNASLSRIERAKRAKELIRQGLTNAEIAERVGVTAGHVQNIRRGWRWAGLP